MGAIHPVSRRKPCPNGLNCPPAFNLTRGNSNTRHAGGYSSRRPRAAGALVRLALRPPCLPYERRQPYAVRLAALALCAGAPVLPDFRPFGALLSCGWYVIPARPRSRLVGRFFRALFHVDLYQPRRASCGGLVGRCLAPLPTSARAGAWLVLSAFAARVRINIRTAAGVSTYADAGTLPATTTRPPCWRPSYVVAVSLPRFRAGAGAGKVSGRACVLARRVRGVSPLFPAPVAILRPYGVGDVWRLTRCAYVPPLLYRRDVSTRAAGAPLRASVLTLSILFQITFGGWLAALVAVRGIAPRLSLNTAAALAGWCLLA